ncbi:hypothetical protein JKP88DRAFT_264685 [Tribonema minus]|uniref:Uncharacterized protein n=1 Tax=Tribonema minus TaxID=303371 RepID=A0A836C9P2_9STRA|nr:hypothetical protein JKP88DRAFT_264685 [Tribonema minus]
MLEQRLKDAAAAQGLGEGVAAEITDFCERAQRNWYQVRGAATVRAERCCNDSRGAAVACCDMLWLWRAVASRSGTSEERCHSEAELWCSDSRGSGTLWQVELVPDYFAVDAAEQVLTAAGGPNAEAEIDEELRRLRTKLRRARRHTTALARQRAELEVLSKAVIETAAAVERAQQPVQAACGDASIAQVMGDLHTQARELQQLQQQGSALAERLLETVTAQGARAASAAPPGVAPQLAAAYDASRRAVATGSVASIHALASNLSRPGAAQQKRT